MASCPSLTLSKIFSHILVNLLGLNPSNRSQDPLRSARIPTEAVVDPSRRSREVSLTINLYISAVPAVGLPDVYVLHGRGCSAKRKDTGCQITL
ncbi:hypothetical protein BDV37DRAFT_109258 [Aspergillus pseudonomiae]|uniref:Uncharacterized protein n=1 Tax=Aspergillus pseudonomiae TaxID=1506151 RepID=A0A5N7DRP8_9EURO|nr:uncharacterized protein BDV37DRAFT_109258 [Aspergillus pseudonomiae]KAE8409131.1 hypothetical protein BDV37DRAFT_109258 [Aspergillus pseudonomiae]